MFDLEEGIYLLYLASISPPQKLYGLWFPCARIDILGIIKDGTTLEGKDITQKDREQILSRDIIHGHQIATLKVRKNDRVFVLVNNFVSMGQNTELRVQRGQAIDSISAAEELLNSSQNDEEHIDYVEPRSKSQDYIGNTEFSFRNYNYLLDKKYVIPSSESKITSLKDELTAVLMRHEVASKEECEALVDDLCAKIEAPPLQLPSRDEAPSYKDRKDKGQNITEFLRDPMGWGRYVEAGLLTRAVLRHLDPSAYNALALWLQSNELPNELRSLVEKQPASAADIRAARRLVRTHERRPRAPV